MLQWAGFPRAQGGQRGAEQPQHPSAHAEELQLEPPWALPAPGARYCFELDAGLPSGGKVSSDGWPPRIEAPSSRALTGFSRATIPSSNPPASTESQVLPREVSGAPRSPSSLLSERGRLTPRDAQIKSPCSASRHLLEVFEVAGTGLASLGAAGGDWFGREELAERRSQSQGARVPFPQGAALGGGAAEGRGGAPGRLLELLTGFLLEVVSGNNVLKVGWAAPLNPLG